MNVPVLVAALILGLITSCLSALGTRRAMRDLDLSPGRWPSFAGGAGLILGAAFVWSTMVWNSQSTPEVIPSEMWQQGRVLYHLTMIVLLIIITATDLRSYLILDWTCWLGVLIALSGAFASGEFQLVHLWVDWNAEIPQLRGPYIPGWLAAHPHLHGLVWSLAGLTCGVVSMWLVRFIGSTILGMNALGSGDVILMAMIGAYLGWQPTLVVVLLAPVLALGIGGFEHLRGNRAALPYGPFLAMGALIVVFAWRAIWMAEFSLTAQPPGQRLSTFAVRRFFGDPVSLLLTFGLSLGLMVLLLGLLRLYKSLPVRGSSR